LRILPSRFGFFLVGFSLLVPDLSVFFFFFFNGKFQIVYIS